MTKEQRQKGAAIAELRERLPKVREELAAVDERLALYFDGLAEESSAVPGDENDRHNVYEILGGLKFLDLWERYEFNTKKVQRVIRLREGEWRAVGAHGNGNGNGNGNQGRVDNAPNGTARSTRWEYVRGGLKQPGDQGAQVYRWQPFQVFVLASVFGFQGWIDTQIEAGARELLPTERINERTGHIEDLRRLCTDFTYYGPRKTDKTGLSAFIQVVFFLMEDHNAEVYCCANSADQSKLLYRRTRAMLQQLDDGRRIRMTETVCDWRPQYKSVRDSSIRPLSAGGKTKDGMFAQLCCADEYGSAGYVNGKSDMKMLVDVIRSSMGPRREPLTFTTTTAGRVLVGPFLEKLEGLHRMLEREGRPSGEPSGTVTGGGEVRAEDRTMCLCLEPDAWERDDEEALLTSKTVRAKVNPMLGTIVQHQFYDDAVAEARLTGDMAEVVTKLYNVYQAATVSEWIRPERIRQLQTDRRIEDCTLANGWEVYVGMDFSQGHDLHAATYLAVRWTDAGCEFFADMDAWVNEETLRRSSMRDLYERWIADGWLHVSPGEVFQPNLPVKRIRELDALGLSFLAFGYDSKLSKEPINELKAWLQSIGLAPDELVVPVSQTYASFNPAVDRLTFMLLDERAHMEFSRNPLWPWEFGCAVIDEDLRMGNKKPVKRHPGSDACKVDNVQCLCECMLLEEMVEGMVTK